MSSPLPSEDDETLHNFPHSPSPPPSPSDNETLPNEPKYSPSSNDETVPLQPLPLQPLPLQPLPLQPLSTAPVPDPSLPVSCPAFHPPPPIPSPSLAPSSSNESAAEDRPLLQTRPSRNAPAILPHPPVTHYHSISVHLHVPNSPKPRPGSLTLTSVDTGGPTDLFSIAVTLTWDPHSPNPHSPNSSAPISTSIDALLSLRIILSAPTPRLILHTLGARRFAILTFPNGPDALIAFVTALRAHTDTSSTPSTNPGDLYLLSPRPRMRRAAPPLDSDPSPRPPSPSPALAVLEAFARVTRATREASDSLATLFSDARRAENAARAARERLARDRALDIFADEAWGGAAPDDDHDRVRPPYLRLDRPRGEPVAAPVWEDAFGEDGVLADPDVLRLGVFAGGVDVGVRRAVWAFLLGVYDWASDAQEREEVAARGREEYAAMKRRWRELAAAAVKADDEAKAKAVEAVGEGVVDARMPDRASRVSKAHAQYLGTAEQIEKDIFRTDRSVAAFQEADSRLLAMMGHILNVYALYNTDIGYCQGMSDYLSPLLLVFGEEDEAAAFWAFVGLMRMHEGNFRIDQSGMSLLLARAKALLRSCDQELYVYFEATDPDFYCIFRWMLVSFKRELPHGAAPRLWEILWTRPFGEDNFQVNIAVALLRAHRRNILKLEVGAFDKLLRYVNDMSQRIDVDFAVRQAELLQKMQTSPP